MKLLLFLLLGMLFTQNQYSMNLDKDGTQYNPLFNAKTKRTLSYLAPENKKEIDLIITAYTHSAQLTTQKVKLPSPIALYGAIGSGKSYTAKALAKAVGMSYTKYDYVSLLGQSMNNDNQICIPELINRIKQIFDQVEHTRTSPTMIIFNNFDHLESFDKFLHDILLARWQLHNKILEEIKCRARHNKHFFVVCELKDMPPIEDNFYKHRISVSTVNHDQLLLSLLQKMHLTPDTNLNFENFKFNNKTPFFLKEIVRICALKVCQENSTSVKQEHIDYALSCLMPKPKLKQVCTRNKDCSCDDAPDNGTGEGNGAPPHPSMYM